MSLARPAAGQAAGQAAASRCGTCRHFRNDAAQLERASPGLAALSSAYGAVRADDGLCLCHDRYVASHSACARFAPALASGYGAKDARYQDMPISRSRSRAP